MRWNAAIYCRLSREDGDRAESESIAAQESMLRAFLKERQDIRLVEIYRDDGYSGTHFQRPAFQQLLSDIEAKTINCVLVKDLSRFGRDYIDVGRYLERIFPAQGVRFIALTDQIDSHTAAYDMLLPLKNVFNEQYAKDISQKVKSALRSKQERGEFIGAFAPYGYRKDPENKNRLLPDPVAAATVRRIFTLYEGGMGKLSIAKLLNREGIPCPSLYKEQSGARYHNGRRLGATTYWTYATIHRMLQRAVYAGHMEQGRARRSSMHGKAQALSRAEWVTVPDTHEALIEAAQWARVQALLGQETRVPSFESSLGLFSGFLRCGDCGRAMSKSSRSGNIRYSCGSYRRYGTSVCSAHNISHALLSALVLEDINALLQHIPNLPLLAAQAAADAPPAAAPDAEREQLVSALARVQRLKKRSYEDYSEGLLGRAEYLLYKADYERQECALHKRQQAMARAEAPADTPPKPWLCALLEGGRLRALERRTLAELIETILIFEDGRVLLRYKFAAPAEQIPAQSAAMPGAHAPE